MDKNRVRYLFILFLFMFIDFFITAKTVRVGYCSDLDNYMLGGNNERKSGYSYDYLQKISEYTGWNYAYVYGERDELMHLLLEGKIDLLTNLGYDEKLLPRIYFSEYEMGRETYYIYAKSKNISSFKNKDLLENITIASNSDYFIKNNIDEWFGRLNVQYDIKYLKSNALKRLEFNEDQVLGMIDLDVFDEKGVEPVIKLGTSKIYIGVSKSKKSFLNELNEAQEKIYINNANYNDLLWSKYFSKNLSNNKFSDEEKEYLNSKKEFKIGCLDNYMPYCNLEKSTNSPEGFVIDICNLIEKNPEFNNCDLNFKYVFYSTYDEMLEALCSGQVDLAFPIVCDYDSAEKQGYYTSSVVSSVGIVAMYKPEDAPYLMDSPAVQKGLPVSKYVEINLPKSYIRDFNSFNECIDSVLSGKSTCIIFDMVKNQNKLLNNKKLKDLKSRKFPEVCNFGFAVRRDNILLLSFINKALSSISAEEKDNMLTQYLANELKYTTVDFLVDNILLIIIVIVFVFVLLFVLIILIVKVLEYANYDSLTHLLNRKSADSYFKIALAKANEGKGEFSISLINIDNFKKINDKYGQEVGDEVLKRISNIVIHSVSSEDIIFRWGGEEILIIYNAEPSIAYKSSERIRRIVESFNIEHEGREVHATITIGIASYINGVSIQDLLITAEEKLYKGKLSGKNQVII